MEYRKHTRLFLGLCLLALAGVAGSAERRDVGLSVLEGYSLTTGLEYESGDYGTSATTKLWRIPLALDYVNGRFSAGINTSYLNAKSSGVIVVGGMTHMGGVSRSISSVSSASGMGDVNMYTRYQFPQARDSDTVYHVTGRIKLGTADEQKGLGTGENDYAVEGGFLAPYQKVYVFGNLGYQISGDSATVNYDNVFYLNAGATYAIQAGRSVGAMLKISQAVNPAFDGPASLTLFLNQELDKQRIMFFYVMLGLSNGSPDTGAGVDITFRL